LNPSEAISDGGEKKEKNWKGLAGVCIFIKGKQLCLWRFLDIACSFFWQRQRRYGKVLENRKGNLMKCALF
jgi:hypothetical protein